MSHEQSGKSKEEEVTDAGMGESGIEQLHGTGMRLTMRHRKLIPEKS